MGSRDEVTAKYSARRDRSPPLPLGTGMLTVNILACHCAPRRQGHADVIIPGCATFPLRDEPRPVLAAGVTTQH